MTHRFFRPEFVYRPQQLFRALWQKFAGDSNTYVMTRLPWGSQISVHPGDYIGHRVIRHGLTALDACEAVFRLMEVGGTALDIGANHGVVTSAMRHRGGPKCQIHSFEMVPGTFAKLKENAARWQVDGGSINLHSVALSDRSGVISIGFSPDFTANSGVAYATHEKVQEGHMQQEIQCLRLDEVLDPGMPVDLMKLDVERHECQVLLGAGELISKQRVRHIIFEDAMFLETDAKRLLMDAGYQVFKLDTPVFGPQLTLWKTWKNQHSNRSDEDLYCDFIATVMPDELLRRFRSKGYRCL